MICDPIKYYIKRLFRLTLDTIVKIIGLIYPSERNYLPAITDRLLLEPAVNLVKLIKTGQVCHGLICYYFKYIYLIISI